MRITLKSLIIAYLIHTVSDFITLCHNFHMHQFHVFTTDIIVVWLAAELIPRYKGVIIWWNKECPNCNGVGHFTKILCDDSPRIIAKEKCSYCEGTGRVPKKKNGELDKLTKETV